MVFRYFAFILYIQRSWTPENLSVGPCWETLVYSENVRRKTSFVRVIFVRRMVQSLLASDVAVSLVNMFATRQFLSAYAASLGLSGAFCKNTSHFVSMPDLSCVIL